MLAPRARRRARHTRRLAGRRDPARSLQAPRRSACRVRADRVPRPRHGARRPHLRHPRYRLPHALERVGRRRQRTRGATSLAATRTNCGPVSRAALTHPHAALSGEDVSDPALAIVKPTESPLARLELACRLLAEARSLDEVKVVVDLAEAARVYARQARLGLEAQNDAAELRLRAERRAGELLAEMQKNAGGRPPVQATSGVGVEENPLRAVTGFSQTQPRQGPA